MTADHDPLCDPRSRDYRGNYVPCECTFIARVRADERQRWEQRAAQFMRENDPDAHDIIQYVLAEQVPGRRRRRRWR